MIIAALAVLVVGCSSGSNSPTQPGGFAGELAVTSADLLVDGESVAGQTMPVGHGEGMAARFEAHLMMDGAPAPGYQMWVEYDRPMGMGPQQGRFRLYDDGTNGDRVPGDGIYCFEDFEGMYACHRNNARRGDYHYEFYGIDHQGEHTNHMDFMVHLGQN